MKLSQEPETPPGAAEALAELQRRLAARRQERWKPGPGVPLVGACYACFERPANIPGRAGEPGWAAAALTRGSRFVEAIAVEGVAGGPYVPGLLALREEALLAAAVGGLSSRPDVLIVNATGLDHPRGCGLAVQLGATLGLPTVGVTDRPLCARGEPPGPERWSMAPLAQGGRPVAVYLVTRAGTRPVVVHPGWETSFDVALQVVRNSVRRARTPEPLRRARRLARAVRAGTARAGVIYRPGEL